MVSDLVKVFKMCRQKKACEGYRNTTEEEKENLKNEREAPKKEYTYVCDPSKNVSVEENMILILGSEFPSAVHNHNLVKKDISEKGRVK